MRNHGVNWLLFFLGYMIVVTPLLFWASFMFDAFWPTHGGERGILHGLKWSVFALWQTGVMAYLSTNGAAKQKEKAANAIEGKPVTVARQADNPINRVPLGVRLRNTFGIGSAIVGMVSVTAHLICGTVEVGAGVLYTLVIPLCLVFGMYLTDKSTHVCGRGIGTKSDEQ